MFTNALDFASRVADYAGCSFECAAFAVRTVLTGIGAWLGPAQRELLAGELPSGLSKLLAGDGLATPLEQRLLAADLTLGQVRELIASVGRALADDLSTQATEVLCDAVPALVRSDHGYLPSSSRVPELVEAQAKKIAIATGAKS